MKCSVKGCKETPVYVLIDAYLDGNSIHRNEINLYVVCINHDNMSHRSRLERMARDDYDSTYELRRNLKIVGKKSDVPSLKQIKEWVKEITVHPLPRNEGKMEVRG